MDTHDMRNKFITSNFGIAKNMLRFLGIAYVTAIVDGLKLGSHFISGLRPRFVLSTVEVKIAERGPKDPAVWKRLIARADVIAHSLTAKCLGCKMSWLGSPAEEWMWPCVFLLFFILFLHFFSLKQ